MFGDFPLRVRCTLLWIGAVGISVLPAASLGAAQQLPCPASGQEGVDPFFTQQVWNKVVANECVKCHRQGGEAEESALVLLDLTRVQPEEIATSEQLNRERMIQIARVLEGEESRLLLKVTGGLDHGGQSVLPLDSPGYQILAAWVKAVADDQSSPLAPTPPRTERLGTANHEQFFADLVRLDDQQVLRRATLSLVGRLPTDAELQIVAAEGEAGLMRVLESVMAEDAFYVRLREAFNDLFLFLGIDGNPDQTVLSYEHFEHTRHWYQQFDLSHIADQRERERAGYKLANEYRRALLEEPLRLIEYTVRHDRPFTEIVTADYLMVSPYTARGYGLFDQLKSQFNDPEDPFEFIPVQLPALKGRSKSENQESPTGFYPHAGVLGTFQYLSRYPTTETNRNRLRARMYYRHFLGVDVLELAARVSDAAAVTAKFENPTMQAAECVVCHRTLDPVAGLFQDYWRFDNNFSIYGRRKEGWFTDMFVAGFEGEDLPSSERWRALAWLGQKTAEDPRFATTMVGHAYFVLTGRHPLLPPTDLNAPNYDSMRLAYEVQQAKIQEIAQQFREANFNFKRALLGWIVSDYYRIDGVSETEFAQTRCVELQDAGIVRLLSPEQLERKIHAIFGQRWGRLEEQTAMLYGAIDSKEVTERPSDPSGAMGAIQRTMANDVACRNVALDFSRPAHERLFFAGIETDVLPGVSPTDDQRIRETIAHLHRRILGRNEGQDSEEVAMTFALFAGVISDAHAQPHREDQEIWSCRQGLLAPVPDPDYTVRAWRAVVTYLLRQPEFLYE